MISATDPVAVVALFKELGAPKRLNILIEGESLFNDATAIVVFGILLAMVLQGSSVTLMSTGVAVIEFFHVFLGGVLVGLLTGLLISEMLQRLQSSISAILVISIVTAYGSFIIAEHGLHVSGVMATVSAAMTLNVYGLSRITKNVKSLLAETWELVGLIANSLLFLLVGLSINSASLIANLGIILAVVVFVQLVRAASVYSLVPITIQLFKLPGVSMSERHIMWWGGLKGGLAIAIVLSIPESLPARELLINLTLGVVLFILLVNASSIRPLMRKLHLGQLTGDEKIELQQGLENASLSSAEMLQKYTSLGIIQKKLSHILREKINSVFSRVSSDIDTEQSWREVYLASLRVEFHTLDELYKSGLISQYTLLDIRNSLQIDREAFSIDRLQRAVADMDTPINIFQRLEKFILRELREKNWAAGLLSLYQRRRLTQRIQHDVAGIVMTRSVLDMLESQNNFETEVKQVINQLYWHRFQRWSRRLDALRNDFTELFDKTEKELFSRSSLMVAQQRADFDLHHGEIGIKAYNKIKQTIELSLNKQDSHELQTDSLTLKNLSIIPLFSKVSEKGLKVLSNHAVNVTFLAGDIIIDEGDKGDALYIISQGVVVVRRKITADTSKFLGELKQGDFFGEQALLGDHVRTATVTAKTAVSLFRLTRSDVLKIAERHDEVRQCLDQIRDERLIEE